MQTRSQSPGGRVHETIMGNGRMITRTYKEDEQGGLFVDETVMGLGTMYSEQYYLSPSHTLPAFNGSRSSPTGAFIAPASPSLPRSTSQPLNVNNAFLGQGRTLSASSPSSLASRPNTRFPSQPNRGYRNPRDIQTSSRSTVSRLVSNARINALRSSRSSALADIQSARSDIASARADRASARVDRERARVARALTRGTSNPDNAYTYRDRPATNSQDDASLDDLIFQSVLALSKHPDESNSAGRYTMNMPFGSGYSVIAENYFEEFTARAADGNIMAPGFMSLITNEGNTSNDPNEPVDISIETNRDVGNSNLDILVETLPPRYQDQNADDSSFTSPMSLSWSPAAHPRANQKRKPLCLTFTSHQGDHIISIPTNPMVNVLIIKTGSGRVRIHQRIPKYRLAIVKENQTEAEVASSSNSVMRNFEILRNVDMEKWERGVGGVVDDDVGFIVKKSGAASFEQKDVEMEEQGHEPSQEQKMQVELQDIQGAGEDKEEKEVKAMVQDEDEGWENWENESVGSSVTLSSIRSSRSSSPPGVESEPGTDVSPKLKAKASEQSPDPLGERSTLSSSSRVEGLDTPHRCHSTSPPMPTPDEIALFVGDGSLLLIPHLELIAPQTSPKRTQKEGKHPKGGSSIDAEERYDPDSRSNAVADPRYREFLFDEGTLMEEVEDRIDWNAFDRTVAKWQSNGVIRVARDP